MEKQDPWIEFPHIWSTPAQFMSYIRGGIRRGLWKTHPVKLEFINHQKVKVPLGKKTKSNPNGMVQGHICAICGGEFRLADCQVDHKQGNHSLKTMDDLRDFIESIIMVTHDDLQMVCKPCHDIKTYADRYKLTFEQAKTEKRVIKFSNAKAEKQKSFLRKKGFTEEQISNKDRRVDCFRQHLEKEND